MVNLCDCSPKSCKRWHPKIERAIKSEMAAAAKRGKAFSLNMSKLADLCGISRPTLYQHELYIEQLRRSLEIDRRRSEGNAQVQALMEKLASREAKISKLEAQVSALHLGIAHVYTNLYLNGISASILSTEIELSACNDLSTCPLRKLGRKNGSSDNIVEIGTSNKRK